MHRGCLRATAVVLSVALAVAPRFALAEPTEQEKQIAKDLFDKGVKLLDEAKCDETPTDVAKCKEAREAFKRAYEMTGALGALRNLAYTEKGLGLVASAARNFRELARKAPLDPKPERRAWADFARDEVKALEPRIPHLVVKVVDKVPGMTVKLDGVKLPEAALNTSIDVDPGQHSVRAEAPGRLPFEATATLAEKQEKTIAVVLDVDTHPPVEANSEPSRVPPLVVAAVGVVGVGVGLGFGYASMKKRDASCDANKLCDPQGLEDGRALANTSTIVTGVGLGVLAVGVVWFALTPSSAPKEGDRSATIAPWASRDGGGLAAFGRF